jgi:hypothetical protein
MLVARSSVASTPDGFCLAGLIGRRTDENCGDGVPVRSAAVRGPIGAGRQVCAVDVQDARFERCAGHRSEMDPGQPATTVRAAVSRLRQWTCPHGVDGDRRDLCEHWSGSCGVRARDDYSLPADGPWMAYLRHEGLGPPAPPKVTAHMAPRDIWMADTGTDVVSSVHVPQGGRPVHRMITGWGVPGVHRDERAIRSGGWRGFGDSDGKRRLWPQNGGHSGVRSVGRAHLGWRAIE